MASTAATLFQQFEPTDERGVGLWLLGGGLLVIAAIVCAAVAGAALFDHYAYRGVGIMAAIATAVLVVSAANVVADNTGTASGTWTVLGLSALAIAILFGARHLFIVSRGLVYQFESPGSLGLGVAGGTAALVVVTYIRNRLDDVPTTLLGAATIILVVIVVVWATTD